MPMGGDVKWHQDMHACDIYGERVEDHYTCPKGL